MRAAARPPRLRSRPSRQNLSRTHRLLFVFALFSFGLASVYSATALLTRVYPVLFPGKNLTSVVPLGDLAPKLGISAPSASSVFNRRINLLIMGIDQRPDGAALEPANTDTIMVASIDPVSQQMSLVSIPRDMWVEQTFADGTKTEDRINASWAEGVLQGKSADAGAQQIERDLKNNFGIAIDYWVLLDFRSAEKLFDAVGGVDVTIPPELAVPQWFYSDDDVHGVYLSFPAGPQHLDGYHAVAFGRYLTTDSDLYRVKRQQLVLTAALSRVLSLGLLNDPFALWDAYSSLIKTDIPRGKMPGYALLLKDANANVRTYSLGDPVNGVDTVHGWTTPGGADVLLWDATNVETGWRRPSVNRCTSEPTSRCETRTEALTSRVTWRSGTTWNSKASQAWISGQTTRCGPTRTSRSTGRTGRSWATTSRRGSTFHPTPSRFSRDPIRLLRMSSSMWGRRSVLPQS